MLQTGDQAVVVVAGPASGLKSLAEARLIDIGDPHEPERVGKQFEERALEALPKGGHQVILPEVGPVGTVSSRDIRGA